MICPTCDGKGKAYSREGEVIDCSSCFGSGKVGAGSICYAYPEDRREISEILEAERQVEWFNHAVEEGHDGCS